MTNNEENEMRKEEVEVVELFDENGESLVFELLANIEDEGRKYLVLTPFIEDESQIDPEVPAEVFVMQEVIKDGDEKVLEPISDTTIVEKIFNKFKSETKDKFDFAEKAEGQKIATPPQPNQAKYQQVTLKFRKGENNFKDEILQLKRIIEDLDLEVKPYESANSDKNLFEMFKSDCERKMKKFSNKDDFFKYFLSIFENENFDTLLFLFNKDFLQQLEKEYSGKYAVPIREQKEVKDEDKKSEDRFIAILNMMELAIDNKVKIQKINWNNNKDELGFYSHLLLFSAKHNLLLFKNLINNIFYDYYKICDAIIVIKAFKFLGDLFTKYKFLNSHKIALYSYKIAFSLNSTLDEKKQIENDLFLEIIRGVCNSYYNLRDYKKIIKFMVDENKKWKYSDLHISWLASGYIPYAKEFALNSQNRQKYIDDFYEVLKNTDKNLTTKFNEGDLSNTAWYLDRLLYEIDITKKEKALPIISTIKDCFDIYEKERNNRWSNKYCSTERDYDNFSYIATSYCYAIFDKVVIDNRDKDNLDISAISDAFLAIDTFMEDYKKFHKENGEPNLEDKMSKKFNVHYRISKLKDYSNVGCKLNDELYRLIRCLHIVCEIIKSNLAFKRNDDKNEEYADVVYYTTLEALYYMLEDKRNKNEDHPSDLGKSQEYKFPVFNVRYLNDPEEGELLFNRLGKKVFDFREKWLLKKEENESLVFDDKMVFVKSFVRVDKNAKETKDKESLPMWSHYGNDSKGCRVKLGTGSFIYLGTNNKKSNNKKSEDFSFRADDDYSLYNIIYYSDSGEPIFKEENKYIEPYFDMFKKIIVNILDFYETNKIPKNDDTCQNCIKDNKCLDTTKVIYDILTPFAYLFKSANYDYEHELRVILNRNDEAKHKEFKEILVEKPFPRICIFMDNEVVIEEIRLGSKLNEHTIGSYVPFIRVQLEKMKSNAKIVKSDIQLK